MPEARRNEKKSPLTTETGAYNGNSVVAVYVSFSREDLLVAGEDSELASSESFLGRSDPLGINKCLESFAYECKEGADAQLYKIKLLNPTTEIEEAFMSFYDSIYPEEQGVINSWVDASKRQKTLEDATGQASIEYASLGRESEAAMPDIYLRWGYGNTEKSGLSKIHKTKLADIKYLINSNQDKVVELTLIDLLNFTKTSQTFTDRQHTYRISALNQDGSYKKPGQIIQEIITGYISIYPDTVPVCQIYSTPEGQNDSSFGEILDTKVFGVAKAMALRSGTSTSGNEENEDNKNRKSAQEWYDSLTEEQRNNIDSSLNAQLVTQAEWKTEQTGGITESILLQAYKTCFEEIGLTFKSTLIDLQTAGTPGRLSTEQLEALEQIGVPSGTYTKTRVLTQEDLNLTVNLYEPEKGDLPVPLNEKRNGFLGFWPMGLESTAPFDDDRGEQIIANIVNIETSAIAYTDDRYYGDGRIYYCEETKNYAVKESRLPRTKLGSNEYKGYVKVTFDRDITNYAINYEGAKNADQGYPLAPGNLQCPNPTVGYNTLAADMESRDPVLFFDIEGTGELNNQVYYLYRPNISELNVRQAYLLSAAPEVDGVPFVYDPDLKPISYTDVPENVAADFFGNYRKGGKIAVPGERLINNPDTTKYPRKLKQLNYGEKIEAINNGQAPIWLKPGVVNLKNSIPTTQSDVDQKRFTFSIKDLDDYFRLSIFLDEYIANDDPDMEYISEQAKMSLPTCYVSIPPPNHSGPFEIPVGTGIQNSTTVDNLGFDVHTAKIPVYDVNTGELVLYSLADDTYGDTIGEYTGWLDSYFNGATPINTSTVRLEPLAETWEYLNNIWSDAVIEVTRQRGELTTPEEEAITRPNANPPVLDPPEEPKIKRDPDREVYVSLGTEGIKPNITQTIQGLLSNLNNFIVGTPQKMRFASLSFSQLTKAQQEEIMESGPLVGIDDELKTDIVDNGKTLALATADSNIHKYTKIALNKVYSFPEITDKNEGVESVIYLDYGTKDSTVMNIKFDAGLRFLLGIAQGQYISRYFADIERYFSSEKNQQQMIYKVLSTGLKDQVELLSSRVIETTGQEQDLLKQDLDESIKLRNKVVVDKNQICSDGVIDVDILQLFPAFVDNYTDSDLAKIVGEESVKDLRILASLVSSNGFMDNLFPNENGFDAQSLALQKKGIISNFGKFSTQAMNFDTFNTMNKRKIDFATAQGRLTKFSTIEDMRKMMDHSFWTKEALLGNAWEVTVDVLGIPEIDIPSVEFLERNVVLRVYDARLASEVPHWVSGLYRITGFSHKIDPSNGYITTLNLLKKPTTKFNNVAGGLEVPEE